MKLIQTLIRLWKRRPANTGLDKPQLNGIESGRDGETSEPLKDHERGVEAKFPLESLWMADPRDRSILIGKNEARERLRLFYPEVSDLGELGVEALSPYVAEINGAVIFSGSRLVVNDRDVALSDEMSLTFLKAAAQPKRNSFGMTVSDGPTVGLTFPNGNIPTIDQGIHLTCEHEHNYFHWITEILPRLLAFERLNSDKTTPLLVSSELHENMYSLLDATRDRARPVIRISRGTAYKVRRLIFPGDVSRILDDSVNIPSGGLDYIHHDLIRELVAVVKENLGIKARSKSNKLYLIRNRRYRIPSNQAEVVSCLEGEGFTAIDTAQLSLQEQVQVFSDADTIVAPSGAACTNMLWAPRGAKMLVLHADHPRLTFGYWNALAHASCVDISYLSGERKHVRDSIPDDFFIDTSALREAILG